MKKYDVLAVQGFEEETLHVEIHGKVPDGSREDCITGMQVVKIGEVEAMSHQDAHSLANSLLEIDGYRATNPPPNLDNLPAFLRRQAD